MSRMVHGASPHTKVVWGGWHASLLPEQTLNLPEVDFVVLGQGEHTLLELTRAIERGATDFSAIAGLGWKRNGSLVFNEPRALVPINDLPPMPYHLLEGHAFCQEDEKRSADVFTSVGCPFSCGFCADRAIYGRQWLALSAERAIDEMRGLREQYRVDQVRIQDSNFFVDWERSITILKAMRDMGMRAQWVCGRVDALSRATEDDLALFHDTVNHFLVGAESGDEETLQLINKRITLEQILDVARKFAEHRVPIIFSTLIGLPHEGYHRMEKGVGAHPRPDRYDPPRQ